MRQDASIRARVSSFESNFEFESRAYAADSPLVAITDGFGLRRANPELRRIFFLAQAVNDPADPVNYVRHMQDEPLRYAATGEETGASLLLLGMVGDMSVPSSALGALGRSAGFIDYLSADGRYGDRPTNQVLIDTHVYEGVHSLNRESYATEGLYTQGVHWDVENLSEGRDYWGENIPRLDPPLRLFGADDHGGESGVLFAYARPEGEHGFPLPLEMQARAVDECNAACESDDCGCDDIEVFDAAFFYFNMIGRFLGTGGQDISTEACMSGNACRCNPERDPGCIGWPEPPAARDFSEFLR